MKNPQPQNKKEAYTKPEVFTHEPLRNITARGSDMDSTRIPGTPRQ